MPTLIHRSHYVLFEHNIVNGKITAHNSMSRPSMLNGVKSEYEIAEIEWQKFVVQFIRKDRPKLPVSPSLRF